MDYQKDPVLRHGSRLIRYGSSLIAILLMATVAQGEEAAEATQPPHDLRPAGRCHSRPNAIHHGLACVNVDA